MTDFLLKTKYGVLGVWAKQKTTNRKLLWSLQSVDQLNEFAKCQSLPWKTQVYPSVDHKFSSDFCTFRYVRMYVSVCTFSELVCDLLPRRLLSWLSQRRIAQRVSQGHNIDEHCLGGH